MSAQSHATGLETCPHCACVAQRGSFATVAQAFAATPVRFQKRTPRLNEAPPVFTTQPVTSSPQQQPQQAAQPPAAFAHYPHHGAQAGHAPPAYQPPSWPGTSGGGPVRTVPNTPIEPVKQSRAGWWIMASILTIAVCAFTGLLAREKIREHIRHLQAAKAARHSGGASEAHPMPIPGLKVDPMEDINAKIATGEIMDEAQRLARVLFGSATFDERLKAVSDPEAHRAEVAAMFDGADAPRLVAVTPVTPPPFSLVLRRTVPVFIVITSKNTSGALLRVTRDDSTANTIDWALFHETHDRLLPAHIASKSRSPKWFHVGLRRAHSFDLPESARNEFDAIDIDGSTDGSGRVTAFVARESPLGRDFARHVEWNKFYLAHVLVSWMDIAGESRPALLDSESASLPDSK